MDQNLLFHQFVVFSAAVHQLTNDLSQGVKAAEITPLQYKILEYLAVSQPVTLSEISQCMHISMPNTSRELRKLTERQLCEKVTDETDRRRQVVRLSPQGQSMMDQALRQIRARLFERIGHLSAEELLEVEQAMDLLNRRIFNP
ncbi:MarR family transcriptional regulator [Paenibacillus sp. JX-17]|uniref:MarR family transcriptional regulator n=1 Tax=Paenibacillus lacisoli TaxID=3064525 RepID=A0ABT9CBP4_9BACL|nr:MarR family transcriptional regulator [Paenibacillus sp. JX-17]MDO7906295.1 MarR family transcriptional regulator [Paenibacillus sp. JX-17]